MFRIPESTPSKLLKTPGSPITNVSHANPVEYSLSTMPKTSPKH